MENTKFDKAKNNKLLLMFLLNVIFQGASVIFYAAAGYFDLVWTVESIIAAIFCFFLYHSYATHNKNVMKPMIGAALAIVLYYEMTNSTSQIQNFSGMLESYPSALYATLYVAFQTMLFVIMILINIIHYSINASHHSSPGKIKANKTLWLIFIIVIIARCVSIAFRPYGTLLLISIILGTIADVFILNMIISIENNLDGYRIAREAEAAAEA